MPDPLDLDALERMEKAATPGPLDESPWDGVSVGEDDDAYYYAFGPGHQCECDEAHDFTDSDGNDTPTDCPALLRARADRDLFRALRNAAPALIARARLAERMAEALHDALLSGDASWQAHGGGNDWLEAHNQGLAVLREWDALNEKGATDA